MNKYSRKLIRIKNLININLTCLCINRSLIFVLNFCSLKFVRECAFKKEVQYEKANNLLVDDNYH